MGRTYLYIGNRKPGDSAEGIAAYAYDEATGALTYLRNQTEGLWVGCVHMDEKKRVLYCTDEREDHPAFRGGGGGQVLAFSVSPADGKLSPLGAQPSYGSKPSFLTTDEEGKYLLVTNHGGRRSVTQTQRDADGRIRLKVCRDESSVVLFPLRDDGGILEPVDLFRLDGEGPKFFQLGAHAHIVRRAPGRNLYAVCDKGGDQLFLFRVDEGSGRLVLCEGSPYPCRPGSAPRYCVFHPTEPWLYVNKEAETLLSSFRYDEDGRLERIETVNTLPDGYPAPPADGLSHTDLCIDAAGRRLYVMLRIADILSVYSIGEKNGALTLLQTLNTPGGGRAFALSPDGRFLAAAFPEVHRVDVYSVGSDGRLGEVVSSASQPAPATVSFFRC